MPSQIIVLAETFCTKNADKPFFSAFEQQLTRPTCTESLSPKPEERLLSDKGTFSAILKKAVRNLWKNLTMQNSTTQTGKKSSQN